MEKAITNDMYHVSVERRAGKKRRRGKQNQRGPAGASGGQRGFLVCKDSFSAVWHPLRLACSVKWQLACFKFSV